MFLPPYLACAHPPWAPGTAERYRWVATLSKVEPAERTRTVTKWPFDSLPPSHQARSLGHQQRGRGDGGGLRPQHVRAEADRGQPAGCLLRRPSALRGRPARTADRDSRLPRRSSASTDSAFGRHLGEGTHLLDRRQPAPARLHRRFARHPTEALGVTLGLDRGPVDDTPRRHHRRDPVDPELGQLLHDELGSLPLQQGERDGDRRVRYRFAR